MEESFIVTSFVVSEKKRGEKNAPHAKISKNTPCEIGLSALVLKSLMKTKVARYWLK